MIARDGACLDFSTSYLALLNKSHPGMLLKTLRMMSVALRHYN